MGTRAIERQLLVVDAEHAFRRKVQRGLGALGHRVRSCEELPEALAAISIQPPALIIADLSLPARGARELFRSIREDERTRHIPFLFLYRGGHPLEIRKGVALDEAYLLKKPFSLRRFIERVTPLLHRLDRLEQYGLSDEFMGTLADCDIYDLFGVIQSYRRTGSLTFRPPGGRDYAVTDFHEGRLVHARHGATIGPEVVAEIMLWPTASFTFKPFPPGPLELEPNVNRDAWKELSESMHLVDLGRLNPCPLPQRVSRPVTPAIVRVTDEFSFGELISGAEPPVLEEHTEDLEELTTPVSSALDTGWDDEWSDEWEVEHFQDGAGGADPWEESSFESLLEQDLDMEETAETLLPDLAPFLAQTTAGLPRPLPYAQAVAEVLRARQASSLGRQGADAALKALAGRLGGEYQWCASHGPILASSVDILLERQRLAGLCSALSRLVAWTSRSDKDPFQHLMMRFGSGTLLFAVLPDRSLLVGLVPPEVPTGVALNEVRQVALLLPALERLSPSLVRG